MIPILYTKRIKSLIKEELNRLIVEVFEGELNTNYQELSQKYDTYNVITYRFETNSKTSYDLEFIFNYVLGNEKMSDGSELYTHILNMKRTDYMESIDIGFTLSDRINNFGLDSIEANEFTKNSNKNEPIELMGRISYLIKMFINSNENINIFIVGKNTDRSKLKIYRTIFKNIFSNNFILLEGEHHGYNDGALYFIKKTILT